MIVITPARRGQQEERDQQQHATQQVEASTRAFFNRNPDAQPHIETLLKMAKAAQFSRNSLNENWLQLQLHLVGGNATASADNFPRTRRSMPNGQSSVPGMEHGTNIERVALIDDDYKSIINSILEEAQSGRLV